MINRVLFQLGLVMAIAMIALTAYLLLERVRQLEAVRTGFWDNLAYTTSQADFELVRLIDALSQSATIDPVDFDDNVLIRYEVALGRLLGLTEGSIGQRVLNNETVSDLILSSIQSLEELEGDILAFSNLTGSQKNAVHSSLRAISSDFHRATVTIASLGDRAQSDFYSSLADAARFEMLMLGLILGAGSLAFANALLERRRFVRLNNDLSGAVAERTAELHNSNDLLRAQVVERSQAEQRFRSLVDHATEAIVVVDADSGAFVEANPRAEDLFGAPRKDLLGRIGLYDLSPEFQPDGRRSDDAATTYITEALDGEFPAFEWTHQNTAGVEVPCHVSLARFPDPTHNLVRGSIVDLTERKRQEATQIELERKLFQAQKLETVGQLTGGVAHDFNNLLSVIMGNMEILLKDTDDPEATKLIQAAVDASKKGSELTWSMLNFARRANLQPKVLDLAAIVEDMENWITRTIPANIDIERSLQPDSWSVKADIAGVESALLNLVVNARDAMPDGGTITVKSENIVVRDSTNDAAIHGVEPGRYAVLSVSDTGMGIQPEHLTRVFDPFFSTKGPNENSGLGLSMVQGFMEQSGGCVRICSEYGVGTTVKLFFPAHFGGHAEEEVEPEIGTVTTRKGRILLVEDQKEVLSVLERILEGGGHEVVSAPSGDIASKLFAEASPIDLLITDIVMPMGMQGDELAKQLRASNPGLPVIFMSGYPGQSTISGDGSSGYEVRLMKPVTRRNLLGAVEHALSEQVSHPV